MKLLLATPANMVLDDATSGHSLIGVFHEIKIQISTDAPEVPSNAMIPKDWALFLKFGLDPEEEGKDYSLAIELYWPDGTSFGSHIVKAAQPTRNGLTFIVKLQAFPMGQSGNIRAVSTLRSADEIVCGPIETEIKVTVDRSLSSGSETK